MRKKDEARVRTLCALLPYINMEEDRPPGYHTKSERQVLVLVINNNIEGYTAWSYFNKYIIWDETVIAPAWQGKGMGRMLMEERLKLAPGIIFGSTHDENEPMIHLLLTMGFHACQRVPCGPNRPDMMLYARGLHYAG